MMSKIPGGESAGMRVAVVATLVATGLGVASCGGQPESPNPISRCYEEPLAPPPGPDPNAPPINLQEKDGVMTGNPQELPAAMKTRLGGAVVSIDVVYAGETKGSAKGFLSQIGNRRVVITNAHVVLDEGYEGTTGNLNAITVTDSEGKTSGVKGGCFIHEDSAKGTFAPPLGADKDAPESPEPNPTYSFNPTGTTIDRDVAVLVLKQPLGKSILHLSQRGPQRGEWNTVASLGTAGDKATRGKLYTYNAMPLGLMQGESADNAYWYAAGLEPRRRAAGATDRAMPGLSGSPIVTIPTDGKPPEVTAMSSGARDMGTLNAGHFRNLFKCTIIPFDFEHVQTQYAVPADTIRLATDAVSQQG